MSNFTPQSHRMKFYSIAVALLAISISSCKRTDVEPNLDNTRWVEENGTSTVEFSKKNVEVDNVELRGRGEQIFVQDGQIWLEADFGQAYLYDYRIIGDKLYMAPEKSSAYFDPASPTFNGTVFVQE